MAEERRRKRKKKNNFVPFIIEGVMALVVLLIVVKTATFSFNFAKDFFSEKESVKSVTEFSSVTLFFASEKNVDYVCVIIKIQREIMSGYLQND